MSISIPIRYAVCFTCSVLIFNGCVAQRSSVQPYEARQQREAALQNAGLEQQYRVKTKQQNEGTASAEKVRDVLMPTMKLINDRIYEYEQKLDALNALKSSLLEKDVSQDTLDYTGPSVNKGSKAMMLGLGKEKIRDLPREFKGSLPEECNEPNVYLPGTLVVQGPSYESTPDLGKHLAKFPGVKTWPVILLVDSTKEATLNLQEFLWTFFTRFEPANDIHGASQIVQRYHVGLEPPIVFDCRMKPWYTDVLEVDEATKMLVDGKIHAILPASLR